jgi:hypothetical protein
MLEKNKEYAVMLCFDVKVDKEAQQYADEQGIKVFTADIIYHLFDAFTKHMELIAEKKKEDSKLLAVFPCVLTPVAVFNKTGPIVVGVDVMEGNLKMHTPIAAVKQNPVTGVKEIVSLGRVYVPLPSTITIKYPTNNIPTELASSAITSRSKSARRASLLWPSRSRWVRTSRPTADT